MQSGIFHGPLYVCGIRTSAFFIKKKYRSNHVKQIELRVISQRKAVFYDFNRMCSIDMKLLLLLYLILLDAVVSFILFLTSLTI
jgi:hypothetical protein